MPQWIDYKQLKSEIAFADVLEHYGVKAKVHGEQAKANCPLPNHGSDTKSRSFSVNLDRNIFRCFGCGAKGNVLDFIALMENHNPKDPKAFYKAAVFAKRKFLYTPQRETTDSTNKSKSEPAGTQRVIVNPPLDFELQGLDPDHPWFQEHGFKPETVRHFGAGYCKRGLMKGRIAFPLHDDEGQLIGYGGRLVDESKISPDCPEYLLPSTRQRNGITYEFDKSLFLYNGHAHPQSIDALIVVEDFLDVWAIWQAGCHSVVAVMQSSVSDEQARRIQSLTSERECVWIVSHTDERLACDVFRRLGSSRFCRWVPIPKRGGLPALLQHETDNLFTAIENR